MVQLGRPCMASSVVAASVLHQFQDVTIFAVYMTACDFEKPFHFHTAIRITGHVRFRIVV